MILIVDDSAATRRIIVKILKEMNLSFLESENGAEALVLLQTNEESIKLVILDFEMPILDGFATLKAIKNNKSFKKIPVIMIGAAGKKENVLKSIKAGAIEYLIKPFDKDVFKNKISKILKLKTL